jgi:hypothetical protein
LRSAIPTPQQAEKKGKAMTNVIDEVAPILTPEPVPVPAPESETPPEEKQVTMTQAQLDSLIKNRQSSVLKRAANLEKENARLKEIAAGSQPDSTELEKVRASLREKEMETDALRAESLASKKSNFILGLAQREGFVDNDVVLKLTRDNFKWDAEKKSYVVLNDEGDVVETTPQKWMQDYATSRPWMVRGTTVGGTGGSGSSASASIVPQQVPLTSLFGSKSSSRMANDLALRDPVRYRTLKAQAIREGLL